MFWRKDTEKGLAIRAIAEKYSVSPSFVSRIGSLWRKEGSVAARQRGGYKRHALHAQEAAVRRKLAENQDITLQECTNFFKKAGYVLN